MKTLKFKPSEILPSVAQLVQVCNGKNIIRMLDYLCIEPKETSINITASDGETWMTLSMPLTETNNDGFPKFCIEATKFNQGLRALSGEDVVKLELNESSHIASFKYEQGHFELPFLDADEYPVASQEPSGQSYALRLTPMDLFDGINVTEFAVDTDTLRPQMGGIRIDFASNGETTQMVYVSTDTRKLVRYKRNVTFGNELVDKGFTLPKKPAMLITNYMAMNTSSEMMPMDIYFDDAKFSIANDKMSLSTRLAAGRYPNYNAVLPEYPNDKVAVVNRDAFVSALKRVATFGNQKTQMVVLNFTPNQIEITSQDVDYNTSAKEKFECQYNGEELKIGFPCNAFSEVIKNVRCEQVQIKLIDQSRAALVLPNVQQENTEYVSIQMPMMYE